MTADPRPPVLVLPPGVRLPRSGRRGGARSDLADVLYGQIVAAGLSVPVREHKFAKERLGRLWRFDLCWLDRMLAVEVEGLTPQGGRHQTVTGFTGDTAKYNAAVDLGWRLYRVTGRQVRSGEALRLVERALGEVRE